MHGKDNSSLEISFSSSRWDYIKVTREFIEEYLQLNYLKNEDISKVIITASELLENALKYSVNGKVEINLRKDLTSNEVFLTVFNSANNDNAEKAIKILNEMNSAADPFSYYITRMRDRATKSIKGGGLGLARIRSEADANLTAQYDSEKSQIAIKAILKF